MQLHFTAAPEIHAFTDYMVIGRNKSERTAVEYARDLARFDRFLGDKSLVDATTEDIERWRDSLRLEGRNQPQSIRRKLAAVSSFFKWRAKKKLLNRENPFDGVEMPGVGKRLPKHVTVSDVEKLLSVRLNYRRHVEFQRARDRAMLEVLYGSGLRRAEICGLDIDDVDLENKTIRVRHGKGDKERFSFLSEPAVHALLAYLDVRRSSDTALFVTIRAKRMTPRQLWSVFKNHREAAKDLGLKKHIVPHGLRHAFATGLYEGGADIRAIQELLGHSNISTTQIYTFVGMDRKRAVYEMAHPRAKAS